MDIENRRKAFEHRQKQKERDRVKVLAPGLSTDGNILQPVPVSMSISRENSNLSQSQKELESNEENSPDKKASKNLLVSENQREPSPQNKVNETNSNNSVRILKLNFFSLLNSISFEFLLLNCNIFCT